MTRIPGSSGDQNARDLSPIDFVATRDTPCNDSDSRIFPTHKAKRRIHSPNSTCTPSLGTPIIKAFEALEADQRATTPPAKIPPRLATQATHAALAHAAESHNLGFFLGFIEREGRSSGGACLAFFSLPL
jgi:hypothetical protein